MSHEMTPRDSQPPDLRDQLARLAEQANEAHRQVGGSLQQAVAKALEAGQALLQAKDICDDDRTARRLTRATSCSRWSIFASAFRPANGSGN